MHYVCIFIQLSYLSEQIIRGDKLKRWGNNGSHSHSHSVSLWERLRRDTSTLLKNTGKWVNRRVGGGSTPQSRAIQNELWLMMVMMVTLMMMKMRWIKFEWLKVFRNNASGAASQTFSCWKWKKKEKKKRRSNSGSDSPTWKIRAWIVYPITDLLSVQKEIKARSNEPCAHAMRTGRKTLSTVGNLLWKMFLNRTQPLTFSERNL